ncbi:MAG: class I SAM-dependent methyltransferase [Wenzhouxiangella sp.]|nr:class I SAM-dependent methyltransferase [Wenzhouxiangella sp.]
MAHQTAQAVERKRRKQDRVLVGNWANPDFLAGERFDTVLLDYVIGAMEAYAPYFQEQALRRLQPLVERRLYIVGVDPYVGLQSDDAAGQLISQIGSVRDACLLLSGERPYREFPMEWMVNQLRKAGFEITGARRFPNVYREPFVHAQLDLCLRSIDQLSTEALGQGLKAHIEDLRARALAFARANNGLKHGADYVISALPAKN